MHLVINTTIILFHSSSITVITAQESHNVDTKMKDRPSKDKQHKATRHLLIY
jgi:hypothetical protein